jgi:hypothetical protein
VPPATHFRFLIQEGRLPRTAGAFLLSKSGDELGERAGLGVVAEIFDLRAR